ncbi:MAG: DUF6279 family lipoprotein [Candidatus Competibacteraceae bacterium]
MRSIPTSFRFRISPLLLLALALLTLALAGCSATRLAYSQLDWLIPQQLGDYVTLDPTQRAWLDARLQDHLAWHCRTQLPAYAEWLGTLRAELNGAPPDPERLQDHARQLENFIDALLGEIAPTAAELAVQLDERQRDDLFARLDRRLAKDRDKYLDPPPDQRQRERAERLERRLRYWLGALTPEQAARIHQWSAALSDQNPAGWLDHRQRLQAAARDLLAESDERSAQLRLTRLLEAPDTVRTVTYQRQIDASRGQAIALAADLLRLATDRQRARLDGRLGGLAADFQNIRCTKETVAALRPESS